jgi:hypothetical protein
LRRYPPAWCSSRFDWPVARQTIDREELLKSYEEIMEILEAFALTGVITRTCGSAIRSRARRTFLLEQNEKTLAVERRQGRNADVESTD